METIRTDLIDRLSEEGYLHVTVEFVLSPAWSTDQITAQGRARLEEYGVAPPPTEAERRQGPVGPDAVGPLPAVRLAGHPRVQPLRLHRLQVAVGVPPLPRALRPLQGPLMDFHSLRVARVDPLTDDAVAITFDVPDDLREAYAFTPGQHLTIRGDDGERRSYSICVPPSAGALRIGVKRLPGGAFSDVVVDKLAARRRARRDDPGGPLHRTSPTRAAERTYVAVAAGSGITPVLSIVSALLEGEPGSFVTLVYANRTHRSVMFLDEVADLKDTYGPRGCSSCTCSPARPPRSTCSPAARRRAAHRASSTRSCRSADVDAWFLCGPQQMVDELGGVLLDAGVPRSRVHTELFHAEPVERAPVAELADAPDGAAAVTVRLDGRASDFPLRPDGPSVLEAAPRPSAPTCRSPARAASAAPAGRGVVEGSVAMDVNYALEPEEIERGYVLTCQSHPTSARLVVDYDA